MASIWRGDYRIYKKYIQSVLTLYEKREDIQIYTELLLSLSAIIVFGLFAIKPTLVTIAGLTVEIKSKQETVSELNTKIGNLTTAQKNFQTDRARLELLPIAMPGSPLAEDYIRQIEGIAKKNSTTILSLSIGDVSLIDQNDLTEKSILLLPEEPFKFFDFSLRATGSYDSLNHLLSDLENLKRPFIHESVRLSLETAGEGQILVLTAIGKIPFFKFVFSPIK